MESTVQRWGLLLAAVALCMWCGPAMADMYHSEISPDPSPGDPEWVEPPGQDGDFVWGSGWESGTPTGNTVLQEGQWMLIGLDNLWIPDNVKTVTLVLDLWTLDGSLVLPSLTGSYGYSPGAGLPSVHGVAIGAPAVTQAGTASRVVYTATYTWRIFPQPDWETIRIYNGNATDVAVTVKEFWSECVPVPEPASLLLLSMGVAGLVARRRRNRC